MGLRSLPDGRQVGDDPRGPRRQAHRHHRGHRVPRHRADRAAAALRARLRARAAHPTRPAVTVTQRAKREIFGNNAFDRLRDELGKDGFDEHGRRAGHPDRRRRRHRRPRPSTTTAGPPSRPATSSSTRPPPCRSTRRSTRAVEVNLLGPTRIVADARTTSAWRRTSCRCRPATSPATDAARRPRSRSTRARSSSTSTGAARWRAPAGPARDAEADSRRPDALERFRKEARTELGAAGVPALAAKTEQRRGAWVKDQMVEAGRARAALARVARRLRLHQGARRAGAPPEPRRRAGVASCARRSSSRRSPSRSRAGSAASAWPSR